jgi:membrane protease YdiL (CAAX protease family)
VVHFAWFMVHTMAIAVVLTWIYNGTRGSLLLVVMYHASINTVTLFVPIANTLSNANMGSYIGYVLLELVTAVIIVTMAGPARLSRTQPKQVQE